MKSVLENPRLLFDLIPKLPYGLFFILSARSSKNSQKLAHYPKELTIAELKGMLYGPLAYLQSRWAIRNARKAFVPLKARIALPMAKEAPELRYEKHEHENKGYS